MPGSRSSRQRSSAERACIAALLLAAFAVDARAQVTDFVVDGDRIARPLAASPGDPSRGRAIVADRQKGLCVLCHSGPFPEVRFQGNLAPDLAGAGARWDEGQLRLRIADSARLDPQTIMPSYHRLDGFVRVAAPFAGRPIFTAEEVEDVVAYLVTLK
jgi:sulfur-oxidizing protein SoxX